MPKLTNMFSGCRVEQIIKFYINFITHIFYLKIKLICRLLSSILNFFSIAISVLCFLIDLFNISSTFFQYNDFLYQVETILSIFFSCILIEKCIEVKMWSSLFKLVTPFTGLLVVIGLGVIVSMVSITRGSCVGASSFSSAFQDSSSSCCCIINIRRIVAFSSRHKM